MKSKGIVFKAILKGAVLAAVMSSSPSHANNLRNTFKPLENTFMKAWPERYQNKTPKGFYHFRGNPSRSYYGVGPFPQKKPVIKWSTKDRGMFRSFYRGKYDPAVVKARRKAGNPITVWTGTGWTGQPVVRTLKDGREEIIFGAYDRAVHFLDAKTGKDTRKQLNVGGIIKGTVSLDPHGDPILYAGPTDGFFRAIRIDSKKPTVFHKEDSSKEKAGLYSKAWDSSPMILGDYLFMGGENSLLYVFKVLKKKDSRGKLKSVKLKKINVVRGYTKKLIKEFAYKKRGKISPITSIESSPVFYKDRIYVANSSGLISGFDINALINGKKRKDALVFEHWVGDDVDATMTTDEDGYLYVAVEDEAKTTKAQQKAARENGHLVKLDPYNRVNPIVWSFTIPEKNKGREAGFYGTPALNKTHVFSMAHNGYLYILNRKTGKMVYKKDYGYHNWSSLVLIKDQLLLPICQSKAGAGLVLLDVKDPKRPTQMWRYKNPTGGCIESTPLVWKGNIYVGSRDGYFYKIGAK